VPVTVTGFTNIGQFTTTIKFDTTRVRFISATTNPSLAGMTVTYNHPVGNTKGYLVFTWTGSSNTSLPDGSALANLTFSYVTGTGLLSWSTSFGAVCQYKRYVGTTLTLLNSTPQYLFFKNGGISNRGAPVTYAPAIGMAAPGSCALPVTVTGFTGIGALTLYLEYDPAVITYLNTFTKNAAFSSSFLVGNVAGANGKMLIVIQWYGSSVSLANGATLCTLNFNYTGTGGTTTTLAWFDNISSCEYADAAGDVLIDLPQSYYYHDGVVAPALVANFSANNLTPQKNETVVFTDLTTGGATTWAWSFDRPGVVFVNGTTASSQNPQVIFTDGGPYSVTLLCTNNYFTDSEIKTAFLRAGISGLWTGNASTDWNTQSNWDNWLVPGNTVSVVIPPAAANWPVYNGDLTIGVQCGSLVLIGATSMMTVTGNLTVPSP
jgi:PKD repeat protein